MRRLGEGGFTLAEILMAAVIVGVALVAVGAGFRHATSGVEMGRQQTMALFLAEQRLEQVKARAMIDFTGVTAANFPAENYGAIANAATYRRTVTITNNPGGLANTALVQVAVFYRPITDSGVLNQESQMMVSSLVASR